MSALEAEDENIEKAVETLRETMRSDLESVQTSIQEENEKRTAVITVKERSASPSSGTLEANPILRFNRVTGWETGFSAQDWFTGDTYFRENVVLRYLWTCKLWVWKSKCGL